MKLRTLISLLVLCLASCSCSVQGKLSRIRRDGILPSLSALDPEPVGVLPSVKAPPADTLRVTGPDGREQLIMRAVRDENGEMVATQELRAAVVVASFKHVAERHGSVDLRFSVSVPDSMLDSRWQLRLFPKLHCLDSTAVLEPLLITGEKYRKAQLRGYQLYQRFLSGIVTDGMHFVRMNDLECFLERNAPGIFALKRDSSLVSEELQVSLFGVSGAEAVEHYTNSFARMLNDRKLSRRDAMFRKYVKTPVYRGALRLDTMIRGNSGQVVYEYVQSLKVRPSLRKARISLSGQICDESGGSFSLGGGDTLTFYISSLATLCEDRERFLTKVISRKVEDNSVCWIAFAAGRSDVDPGMDSNAAELGRIRAQLAALIENERFDIDSIIVCASASPEGSAAMNTRLSLARSRSVGEYFSAVMKHLGDSLRQEAGVRMSLSGEVSAAPAPVQIRFIPRSLGENWGLLSRLVAETAELDETAKQDYDDVCAAYDDLDEREKQLRALPSYGFLRSKLYPHLRTVRFDFHLHRRGMVTDTLVTTEPDTVYRMGLKALKDRDYARAVSILRPYADFNTLVAYCAMDYDASALALLEKLEPTPASEYIKAVLYSRKGNDSFAVEAFLKACAGNSSYIYRGSLDPEISKLIKNYKLQNELQSFD